MTTTSFSAIIADDLPLVGESLAALCDSLVGCHVVGRCNDGEEALRMIRTLQPDLAVLDLNLARLSTLEVMRLARQGCPDIKIVVLSTRGDRRTVVDVLRTGANAFVLKSGTFRHLEDAFRHVMLGGVYVSPLIELQQIVSEPPAPSDPVKVLSAREYQVFTLLVEGTKAKDIANQLSLSPKTVDTYRASLMRKLDIHDMPSLVKFAIRHQLTR